jgi:plastocyanin
MRIRVCIAGFVPLAAALLLGASQAKVQPAGTGQTQAAVVEVKIDNFSFSPATLTVSPGTTVTWTNRDDIPHTVVSDDKIFKSKVLDTDEKFSYTFDKPGSYPYFCSVHPKMTGKVVVQ